MLVKRYHAKDMSQAMVQIVKELGSDAVILSNRKVRKKGFQNYFKPRILEVMVAYDPALIPSARPVKEKQMLPSAPPDKEERAAQAAQAAETAKAVPQALSPEVSSEQFARLDKRIDSLDEVLGNFIRRFEYVKRDVTFDYPEEIQALVCNLVENQVREELAHNIAKETDAIWRKQNDTNAEEVMEQVIAEIVGTPSPVVHKKFKQKVILMLGPTGVGKTTSIVKLAADFAITQKKKVGIINTDTYRIAAQEQLRTYADILNISLSVVYDMSDLQAEMNFMSDREVVFIDTAGKRPGDEKHTEDVRKIIKTCEPEDILLCIPATVNFPALKEVVDAYSFIENYKLLVTKIDETRFRGMILNLCWYTKKPLSYFTNGQDVPDDIEKIDAEKLARDLLRPQV
jgi:flagellar biosynthesis protein FlhF